MLQITARLFKEGQLVGYRLTDGTQTQDLTKIQAWMYAKNKQIINVTATGTQDDPQLSGVNGFKLKELPEIKFSQESTPRLGPLDTQTVTSTLIRHVMKNGTSYLPNAKAQFEEFGRQLMKEEINSGLLNGQEYRKYSNSLLITNLLVDSSNPHGSITMSRQKVVLTENEINENREYIQSYEKIIDGFENLVNRFKNEVNMFAKGNNKAILDLNAVKRRLLASKEIQVLKEIKDKYPECRELAQVFIDEFKDIEVSGKYNTSRHLVTAEDIMKDIDEINCKVVEVRKILSETLSNIPTTKTVRGLTETSPTIGYIVKNNGKEPIKIDRITIKPLGKVPTVLNPGQSIALSRAEVAVLAAKPEVCGVLKNAKLVASSKKGVLDTYTYLNMHYIKITDEYFDTNADGFRLDAWKVVKPNDIFKYFPVKGFGK